MATKTSGCLTYKEKAEALQADQERANHVITVILTEDEQPSAGGGAWRGGPLSAPAIARLPQPDW